MAKDNGIRTPVAPRRSTVPVLDRIRIIDGLKAGKDEAFEAFVDSYGNRIFGFSMKICGHRQDAEDVMQDTLIKAFGEIGSLRSPEALDTWLYRIAANTCLMRRRKERPERGNEPLDDILNEYPERPAVARESGAPEEELLSKERLFIIMRAIRTLPRKMRLVMILRDMEGFSTREVADIMKMTETNVKVVLHRGRSRVRGLYEEAFGRDAAPGVSP